MSGSWRSGLLPGLHLACRVVATEQGGPLSLLLFGQALGGAAQQPPVRQLSSLETGRPPDHAVEVPNAPQGRLQGAEPSVR